MIFLKLFITFFKIGLFTFGGGYAMLPLIQEEVLSQAWLSESDIINFIAVSESTPGPFAVNIATYIGSIMGNTQFGILGSVFGAFCATLGVVLPSFLIILIIARCYEKFKTNHYVIGVMTGLKPAVIGLIGAAVISVAKTALFSTNALGDTVYSFTSYTFICAICIFIFTVILAFKKVHPIILISISAIAGIALGYLGEYL